MLWFYCMFLLENKGFEFCRVVVLMWEFFGVYEFSRI